MLRRTFLTSTIAASATALLQPRLAFAKMAPTPNWVPLKRQLGDRLLDVHSPLVAAAKNPASADALFARMQNP